MKLSLIKLKAKMNNKESFFKKELQGYQLQIDELKKANAKLIVENHNLKQKIEKNTGKAPSINPIGIYSKISRKKFSAVDQKLCKTPEKKEFPIKNEKKNLIKPEDKSKIHSEGCSITYYPNKDIQYKHSDGTKEYFFAEVQTTQITYPNGQKQIKFINGQEEIHFPDGSKEIRFEDKTIKYVFPNGHEKIVFPDGTVQQTFQSSNLQVQ